MMKLTQHLFLFIFSIMLTATTLADNTSTTNNQNTVSMNSATSIVNPGKGLYLGGDLGSGSSECNNWNLTYTGDGLSDASGTYMALGAGYTFSPHWTGTLSYNRVLTSDADSNFNITYGALGITYLAFS